MKISGASPFIPNMRAWVVAGKIFAVGMGLVLAGSCSSSQDTPSYASAGSKSTTKLGRDSGIEITDASADDASTKDAGTEADCSVSGTAGCPCTEAGAIADCG